MGLESKLARLQRRVSQGEGRFPFKFVLQVPTEVTDERGGTSTTYADVLPAVEIPCRYEVKNGKEIVVDGITKSVTAYTFTFPAVREGVAVDVQPKYRLRLLARAPFPERIFQIEGAGDHEQVIAEVLALLVEGDN